MPWIDEFSEVTYHKDERFWHDVWDTSKHISYYQSVRALCCLKHLLRESGIESWWILEIWPLSIYDPQHIAPISIFKKELSNFQYIAVGKHMKSEEILKHALHDVHFIDGEITHFNKNLLKQIQSSVWNIDIIYSQHVFENSSTWYTTTFPQWQEKMLLGAYNLLARSWFLIIDNHWGSISQIPDNDLFLSENLTLYARYNYNDAESKETSIFVFQKKWWYYNAKSDLIYNLW